MERLSEGVEVDVIHAVLLANLLDDGGYRRIVVLIKHRRREMTTPFKREDRAFVLVYERHRQN